MDINIESAENRSSNIHNIISVLLNDKYLESEGSDEPSIPETDCTNNDDDDTEQTYVDTIPTKLTKRVRRPENWARNVNKMKKIKGSTGNYSGIGKCRCKCAEKLTREDQIKIHAAYRALNSHAEQTLFLKACIHVKQKRKRLQKEASNRRVFSYTVIRLSGDYEKVELCQKAFLELFVIKKSRLVCKVQQFDKPVEDRRGKHDQHTRIADDCISAVHIFLSTLPYEEISRGKGLSIKKRLSRDLSISKLWKMFCDKHPEHKISDAKFRIIFKTEYNFTFAPPVRVKQSREKSKIIEVYE